MEEVGLSGVWEKIEFKRIKGHFHIWMSVAKREHEEKGDRGVLDSSFELEYHWLGVGGIVVDPMVKLLEVRESLLLFPSQLVKISSDGEVVGIQVSKQNGVQLVVAVVVGQVLIEPLEEDGGEGRLIVFLVEVQDEETD